MKSTDLHRLHRSQIALHMFFLLAAIFLIGGVTVPATAQQPGDLDLTFSGDGKLIDGITHADEAGRAVAIQPDGKIVVAGESTTDMWGNYLEFALVRYDPDGSLDTSFGDGGKVTGPGGPAYAVAIQPDGRIIVAGQDGALFALLRFNRDGSPDMTFDGDGKVTTRIGSFASAHSIAIQPDGKIVAAGYSGYFVATDSRYDYALARYNVDGSLDMTFDGDGKLITSIGTFNNYRYSVSSVAIQSDGKIVAAGSGITGAFVLARYSGDGSIDSTFGSAGLVTTPLSASGANAVAIQVDGKIVAVGGGGGSSVVVRYSANGSLDPTFSDDGKAFGGGGQNPEAFAVAIQPDGKIVAAGKGGYFQNAGFTVDRYNPDGSPDTTFNRFGSTGNNMGGFAGASAVAIQNDGKIIAAGAAAGDFALPRYNTNGSIDATFGHEGKVITDFGIYVNNSLRTVECRPDGKIVTAGIAGGVSAGNYWVSRLSAVVRYNDDGTPDATFGTGTGTGTGRTVASDRNFNDATFQSDGKIAVLSGDRAGGCSSEFGCNPVGEYLDRYLPDGSIESTLRLGDAGFDGARMAIQSDGKIVVANSGFYPDYGGYPTTYPGVNRYMADGSPDPGFAKAVLPEGYVPTAVSVQPDGKIVVADVGGMFRVKSDGSSDSGFGSSGRIDAPLNDQVVAFQTDGKVVVAGSIYNGSISNFALARYTTDGALDTTFANSGVVTTPIGPFGSVARSLAFQSDGKIVAAGSAYNGVNEDFVLVRYNTNGSLDVGFGGGDGIATLDFDNSNDTAYDMTLDNKGRAVVVGDSNGAFAVARFLLGPSVATVSVSGRVMTSDGRGLRNAVVTIVDQAGNKRIATTSSFGFYRFDNVVLGGYRIAVSSKLYRFADLSLSVNNDLTNVDIVGQQ